MKKLIAFIMLVIMTAGTGISQAAVAKDKEGIADLISKYEGKDGFTIISLGSFPMGLVKMVANQSAEASEDREALDILDGIHKFVVVEYEEASAEKKKAFSKELSALLKDAEKMIEVKDGGDSVDIYGTLSKDGEKITDVIIHIPEDCTFVCFFGSIRTEDLGDVVKMTNE